MTITELARQIQKRGTPWYEKARLIETFHLKMLDEHGHKISRSDDGWSMQLTAKYLKLSKSYICQAIHVAEVLRARPRMQFEYGSIHDAYMTEKG